MNITTTRVEIVVAPNMDVVRRGTLIQYVTKLGSGSDGIWVRRNLSQSLALPITTIGVIGTPHMVFTNMIMTIDVNMTTYRPLMSSMAIGRYRNIDVANPRGGYQKPSIVIAQIPNHRDGHYVRPNKLAFKYPNFKKDDNPNVHVKVFNFVLKANVETFKEYVINVFSYTLKDTTSNWCNNYMSKFPDYIFFRAYISIL